MLHATSTALMQALREVLLDSDFENAMKALTSWIPVKNEELDEGDEGRVEAPSPRRQEEGQDIGAIFSPKPVLGGSMTRQPVSHH